MKSFISIAALLATAFTASYAAVDPNFHIYLAFGQSNMEGDGDIEAQDKTVDSRFKVLCTTNTSDNYCHNRQLGQWYSAVPPLANCNGKLSVVDYFGRTMVKNLPSYVKVGVVVVGVAGSDIQLWEKNNYKSYNPAQWMKNIIGWYGGNPYGRLVEMGKKAKTQGVIKGILLHQGETNSGQQDWPNRVKNVYNNLLNDLGLKASEVPLLVGETVQTNQGGACGYHNNIIAKVPSVIPTAHIISSSGLAHRGDNLHFNSAGYRTIGQRYANEMLKLLGNTGSGSGSGKTTKKPKTSKKTTTKKSNNNKQCADAWKQCGGKGFTGPTCCKQGYCRKVYDLYYHCHVDL